VHAKVIVHDISGEEDKYKLDIHGFQLLRHESKEKTFDDEERIKSAYYKECEEIYKRMFVFPDPYSLVASPSFLSFIFRILSRPSPHRKRISSQNAFQNRCIPRPSLWTSGPPGTYALA
jgi:hypothetical protein